MSKAVYQLESLTCPSCIKKIETTLNKTNGVESTKVLFNTSKVKIEFDEVQVKASKLEETIKKLGYPVLSSKVS
ncbi:MULTISPECIES: heavy-metal-associated domain-containing protein [Neobacillus]|jgi:copper chaperone|uniref:heavy-metal-associated domain-containing protein n=1 Tax=Neobacillus TaxID=2675232 RepID=UPI000BF8B6F4|nr:heavy-metal-associated domain-containing protein [Neobacillus sp. OS1-33]PEQ89404.1 heavy metal-binding protein [Bacillus sp. AFS006103]WML28315.1 heavy-metal-associated domain-containing protein [Neobacillus sp. OS1-33]